MIAKDINDAALGCLLGALVGDAAGATLEFIQRKPTLEEVRQAMTMPGGGFLKVAPGQITDDGELTLCLAHALANSKAFDSEKIARKYAEWMQSRPFDVGNTTRSTLGCFLDYEWKDICRQEGYAAAMAQAAYYNCLDSKANGSLMRATPLGVWGHRLKIHELALFAREDSRLSHSNRSCRDAVACYAIAIAHLMNEPGDGQGAFAKAKDWADRNATGEVCEWLVEAEQNIDVPYHPQIGFIKIAFTHAFRHLLLGTNYLEAIRETLCGGGDTDTNACIVGGLIGAACGATAIPDAMKMPVLQGDTQQGRHPRPEWLHAKQITALTERLLQVAPK
ncbi:MAG: ADP-ribosylglycohydrolase family protein [Acidobacteria bacterium]|nr:ADP-ribosylglycohydrolase family protein [Acidobacteriota bacterium]